MSTFGSVRLRRLLASEGSLLLAFVFGASLRLHQISLQIIGDDEWHSLHAVLTETPFHIVSHFGAADYCIPLTLAFETALAAYGLSEMIMRFPVLAAGFALLIVGPLLVRPLLGRSVAHSFAWFVAVSPLLVFYSRYVRPYSISTFLAFLGACSFYRWWRGDCRVWRWVYIISAVLAPYFHLSTIVFVGVPLLYGLWEKASGETSRTRDGTRLMWTAVVVLLGWLSLLGLPLAGDVSGWSDKVAHEAISFTTVRGAIQLLAGSSSVLAVLSLVLLAGAGALIVFVTQRRLGIYLLLLLFSQAVVTVALGPTASQVPIVFARYCLAGLPILLLLIAIAAGRFERLLSTKFPLPPGTLAFLLGVGLLLLGPLLQTYRYPNNWTNHGLFQYYYDQADPIFHYGVITTPPTVPRFYRDLGERPPGSVTLLEAPWYYEWHNNPFPHYQVCHRQKMIVGFVDDPDRWDRAGEYPPGLYKMRFRNFVHLSQHDQILSMGVDYVVLHKNLAAEVAHNGPRSKIDMSRWIEVYRARYGSPNYEDSSIIVFGPGVGQ